MNVEETRDLIETIRGSFPNCYLDPDVAQHTWHAVLRALTPSECKRAVDHFLRNTDQSPTPKGILHFLDTDKRDERMRRMHVQSNTHYKTSAQSFMNVRGKTRGEQVAWVQADQAAGHYRNGETDNEFYNDLLIKARAIGFEFDGVDYKTLKGSGKAWKSIGGLGML